MTVPTEPLAGIEKPLPRRMTSPSDARCRPWDEVRIRTSWPRCAQVLVQVADVLGDAARQRVDVRGDEADLHRRPSPSARLEPRRARGARRGSRDRARCRRAGAGRRPRPARRGRTCAAGGRTSRAGPAVPWKLPWWRVSRARIAARTSSSVRPGNVVQPVPMASAACASLLPTWASPCSAAKRTTRSCQYRPSAVGLNVSIASGRTAGSASSSRRRSTKPWAHSGYGTRGCAGIAIPPCSWTARDGPAEAAQGGDRPLEEQPQQVPAARADLLADDDPGPQAAIQGDPAGRERRVDPLVVGDRDDVQDALALDVVEDLGHGRRAVGRERVDVQVGAAEPCRGIGARRPAWSWSSPLPPARPARPGRARSGGRRPTTARARRRRSTRTRPRWPPCGR